MLVSAILVAILLAGGYALFLWLRQQRDAREPPPPPRTLTSEREKNTQPIELATTKRKSLPHDPLAQMPGGPASISGPNASLGAGDTQPNRRSSPFATAPTLAPGDLTERNPPVRPVMAPRPIPEMTAAVADRAVRARAKTEPDVVTAGTAPHRRIRRRDPTVQISADELATITIDDEGTTLGVELRGETARDSRRRVSMQSEFDLSIDVALGDGDDEPSGPFVPVAVAVAGATDVGKKRKHNEDAIAIDRERNVYVLADGMGGYAAGEVASQMCVDTILRAYQTGQFGGDSIAGLPPRGDELVRAIQTANHDILTESRSNEARAGMGTTVVAVRLVPDKQRAYIAHVGDSRLYRLRKDELVQMTADHTLGAQGVTGPAAQKLSRAVGVFDEVEVDLNIDVPEPGDVYLICSDGLFKMVHELRIVEILAEQKDPQAAANALVAEANGRGGKDNISVIILRVSDVDFRRRLN